MTVFKKTIGSRMFDAANYTFLILFSLLFIYPFYYVLIVSVSDINIIALNRIYLIPEGINFNAFSIILSDESILSGYWNTIKYAVTYTLLVLFASCISAYPLTQRKFYGKGVITIFFTIPMFISGGLIPYYLLIKGLGMIDTIWAIIVPSAISFWNIILVRTNFQSLPDSLSEAAYMDGAGHWRILFQIIIPLSKPILATIALFAVVAQWNSFFSALLFLTDSEKMPLQMVLRKMLVNNVMRGRAIEAAETVLRVKTGGQYSLTGYFVSLQMAAIIVSIGPIIAAYPFAQKYFTKGVLIGSIRG